MHLNTQKERFSDAFLLAIAAAAACSAAKPAPDIEGVDWTLSKRLPRRPKVDIQLKCTAADNGRGPSIGFPLERKNYDDLIDTNRIIPMILVLVVVPENVDDWISCSPDQLSLRRCAWWMSLAGQPPTENSGTVTVYVPRNQVLTVESLCGIMERIDRDEAL